MNETAADTLIQASWIAPVAPGDVLRDHTIVVRHGRILELLPAAEARARHPGVESVELPGQLLIPGLVNAHTHAAMSLFRGLADDLPLMTWLHEHIWPAEGRWISEAFIADGTALAAAEMLRGGTTCFNDMYFFPDVTARVCSKAGLRAVVGLIVIDFATAWAEHIDDYFDKGLKVHDAWRGDPLIHTAFAPHAPYSVSDAPLQRLRLLADELDIPVHIHLHETRDEIRQGLASHGQRPIARLDGLGLIGPRLVAVHMTQLEDDEIALIAERGARVVHCPESNLKLASGFCPVARLAEAGVELALGTDGAASNNDLDMIDEMRSAALLAKGVAASATALPAPEVLRMATLNGARALGLEAHIGSLEAGKSADIVAVDLNAINTQPVYDPVSQLVYSAGREQVSNVWVAGRRVLHDGRLTTLDESELRARAQAWRARIAAQ